MNPAGFIGNVLYVVGTPLDDVFVINTTTVTAVTVTLGGNAVAGSPFGLTGRTISAFGNEGNDTFTLSGGVATSINGGAGNDTFDVSGLTGTSARSLIGGGGSDTVAVVATSNVNFTLTNAQLTIGTLNVALSGIGTANLTGWTGNNTFTVSGWTGGGTLTGGGGTDTVVASKNVDFTLTGSSLGASDAMNLTISAIGTANLTGGAGPNTYNVSGWTGAGTFAAGGGTDTLNYTNDVATIVLTNASVTPTGGAAVTLSGFEIATLTGGTSNNSFDVGGWTNTTAVAR